ncbi:patatin phospholipase [Fusarium austroafricanum]|uniref:Patatin phospholipase n=1 Tax=Fusarium austroafricanum TaxID=2364996 RepID=A0A8H4NRA9_9HYPO|nr:patatin phospholipase [Fusarium austroafricanum]
MAANDSLEATSATLYESLGALYDSFSAVLSVTEERGVTSTMSSMDIDVSFQENSTEQVSEVTKARIAADLTSNNEELIGRVPMRDSQDVEYHDRPLSLDQKGTEFEVGSLVAKGRIGRRVWYKVKWKGYPETDNSGVKKTDIGTGATANYEARHPQGQSEFKFERLVSKQDVDGIILYKAKWQGQPESENIWVDK